MSSGYFGQSDQMEHRQLGNEMGLIASHSQPVLDQERGVAKQMGQDQLDLSNDFAKSALQLYPQLTFDERMATRQQRTQDARDLSDIGGRDVAALNKVNPGWQQSLANFNADASTAGEASPLLGDLNGAARMGIQSAENLGPSALRLQLEQQAQGDLAAGRDLTPEQLRDVQQSSRAAYSARGLSDSNPALIGEVLARDQYATQRLGAARQFAAGVQQMGQNEDTSLTNRAVQLGQFGGQVEGLNQAQLGQRQNILANAVGVNQQALQPVLGLFGGRSGVSPTAGGSLMSAAPNIINAGATAMNPLISYDSDLFNTNFNSDAATRISNANNLAAIHGAIIGAVGNLAGGAIKCWVAREVYGLDRTPGGQLKWEIVREWVIHRAPRWLHNVYARKGALWAVKLRTRPHAKAAVRWMMDRVIIAELRREAQSFVRRVELLKSC